MDTKKEKQFDWTIWISFTTSKMKLLGLWPEGENYKFDCYGIWASFCLCAFTWGHPCFQVLNVLFTHTDIKSVMSILYVTLSEVLIMLKAYLCVKNMKILKKNLVTLNSDMFQPRNEEQIQQINSSMKFWKWNSNFYWFLVLTAVFFWSTYPVIDGSVKKRQLPFIAWYPFNTTVSPNYEILYFYQVCGTISTACTALTTDTLIAALHMYIALQFDILYDDIKHLHNVKKENSTDVSKKLASCVVHHRAILKFAEDTAHFTNWIVFGQFFISASALGITMFQLTMIDPFSSEFFSIIAYFFAVVVQIFIYCWFGNEVEVKSTKIPYAFFESEWIDSSKANKKEMIIMTERCLRPSKVSALNLFYLSLDTFMKILRVAYSYFALLHQITSGK